MVFSVWVLGVGADAVDTRVGCGRKGWQRLWFNGRKGGFSEDPTKNTPRKIKILHMSSWRFGSDHVLFFSWVICRFQPLIFQGVADTDLGKTG